MKLVFPDGEHPQVLLGHGVNRVGSDPESTIVLDRPGVMPQHCQLHVSAQGVMLDVPPGAQVRVNGRQVAAGLIALRPGDDVAFDEVRARLAAIGPSAVRHRCRRKTRRASQASSAKLLQLRATASRAFARTAVSRSRVCSLPTARKSMPASGPSPPISKKEKS